MQELEAKLREEERERKRMQAKAAEVSWNVSSFWLLILYYSLYVNKRLTVGFLDLLFFGIWNGLIYRFLDVA